MKNFRPDLARLTCSLDEKIQVEPIKELGFLQFNQKSNKNLFYMNAFETFSQIIILHTSI